jgi:hypothetical protein
MRIIGGKYLNWGPEAIRQDTGTKMEMVRVKDGDMTRLGISTLDSVMLMFRASCDLEVKNTPPGSPTGIVFR